MKLYTEPQVLDALRSTVKSAGGQREFCRVHELSYKFLNDVVCGRRPMSPRVLETIGFQRAEQRYVRKPKQENRDE